MQSIRTMASLADRRRARSSAGALLEMSALANERTRLQKELDRLRSRQAEIEVRFAEIEEKERRLHAFVKEPRATPQAAAAIKPIPVGAGSQRVSLRELRY